MRCVNCGNEIIKTDMNCSCCGSSELVKSGLWIHRIIGFVSGFVVPSLLSLFCVIFLNDKRVRSDFLNATISGRSKWQAARVGAIFGMITKFVFIILAFVVIVTFYIFKSNQLLNIL